MVVIASVLVVVVVVARCCSARIAEGEVFLKTGEVFGEGIRERSGI